jgi:hypothetical protein
MVAIGVGDRAFFAAIALFLSRLERFSFLTPIELRLQSNFELYRRMPSQCHIVSSRASLGSV